MKTKIKVVELNGLYENFDNYDFSFDELNKSLHHTYKPELIILHVIDKKLIRFASLKRESKCDNCIFQKTLWSEEDQKYHCAPFSCSYVDEVSGKDYQYSTFLSGNYNSLYLMKRCIKAISEILKFHANKGIKILFINIKSRTNE